MYVCGPDWSSMERNLQLRPHQNIQRSFEEFNVISSFDPSVIFAAPRQQITSQKKWFLGLYIIEYFACDGW